jgi:hypothetical protein
VAQPLKATWEPQSDQDDFEAEEAAAEAEEAAEAENSSGKRRVATRNGGGPKLLRIAKSYGWRVYALPVLIVLTVLALMNTATNATPTGAQAAGGDAVATESGAKPVNLSIPTAELPTGGAFTPSGAGAWHVVPGQGPKVGTGEKLYTYTVEVENGIDPASYAGDDGFASAVESTLSDPRSWTHSGKISFQRVDASYPDPSFRVSLTTPDTVHRPDLCGFQIQYEASCRRKTGTTDRVVINLARWVRGALAFSGDLGGYRQYAINHEVGHALGNGHVGCAENGAPAPVMMQQSFGVSNNYVAQLNQVDPANYSAVPADGKVCKPNSWPNP